MSPLDLESGVEYRRQQLLAEAHTERLAKQIPRRRSSVLASLLAALLYGLAARLDESAMTSLADQPRGLITA